MELTARHQSLSAIAGLEAKGDLERLYTTIDEGLNRGLTVAEIKEALSQLYAYTGFPRSLNALGQLQKVVTDRKAKGISTELGNDGDILPKDFNSLQEGRYRHNLRASHLAMTSANAKTITSRPTFSATYLQVLYSVMPTEKL